MMRLCCLAYPDGCIGVRPKRSVCAAGEWLCWPCKLYEEQQLAAGTAQAEIRKPRWEATAGSPTRCRRCCIPDSRPNVTQPGVLERSPAMPSAGFTGLDRLCWRHHSCRSTPVSSHVILLSQGARLPALPVLTLRSAPHAKPPGGSRDAVCMACPVRLGAFKRTTDGAHWVHMVRC